MSAPGQRLAWDSEHFGLAIGRVLGGELDERLGREVIDWAAGEEISCLYLLADASDSATVLAAEALGFRLADVRLTLDRPVEAGAGFAHRSVRPAHAADLSALEAIAAVSHTDSRFYADNRFDAADASRLYVRWMRASIVEGFADIALVAEADGRPAGYVTGRTATGTSTLDIGLLAVAEAARGRRLGTQLVDAMLHEAATRGVASVSVVTQGRNVQAQRLYKAAGFRTCRSELWLHRWS